MKHIPITDQAECLHVLDSLEIRSAFQPTPPQIVCDGIMPLDDSTWIIGTNDRGAYTLHLLENCSKGEAWAFFNQLRGPNTKYIAPRITFAGTPQTAANN